MFSRCLVTTLPRQTLGCGLSGLTVSAASAQRKADGQLCRALRCPVSPRAPGCPPPCQPTPAHPGSRARRAAASHLSGAFSPVLGQPGDLAGEDRRGKARQGHATPRRPQEYFSRCVDRSPCYVSAQQLPCLSRVGGMTSCNQGWWPGLLPGDI